MEQISKYSAIEAILFATGRAVTGEEIARALEIGEEEAAGLCAQFAEEWNGGEHGTEIVRFEDAWQMCTRKEYYGPLITLEMTPRKPRMTEALLETLSVIAYRQPVTKSEIERIRGVSSDHAVNRLVEFDLVKELGRANLPGRPILFGTTEEFLRQFGVTSKETLPEISPVQVEDFRAEAEEEVEI